MKITKYADINNLLEFLINGLADLFSDTLIGAYVFGSLVWGDFNYDTSDIDILVVLKSDISQEDFLQLQVTHELLFREFPAWDQRIEIAYVSQNFLKTFKNKTHKIALLGHYEAFPATRCRAIYSAY